MMVPIEVSRYRLPLEERRRRLLGSAGSHGTEAAQDRQISVLLAEVDAALERIEAGTFGLCETCHEPVEADRLAVDPLLRFCLDHLSANERRAFESDLELAARIQANLLPPRTLAAAGWETDYRYLPAGPVSGDYCELIRAAGGGGETGAGLYFALGDVAGKGVAASLLMTHLSAILRSLVSVGGFSVAEIMRRANRLLCEGSPTTHYATLVSGWLDNGGHLELVNAGHCKPLVAGPGWVSPVQEAGLPVGLFCSSEYPVNRLRLESGQSLVLYSDGLTEARNAGGEEYGEARVVRLLEEQSVSRNPHELAEMLLADWERFRAPVAASDDVTLLIVQRST